MTATKDTTRGDPEGIIFIEADWDVRQSYHPDPLLPAFFEALKQKRLLAGRTPKGRTIFPPSSFCEATYDEVTDLVPVGPEGVIRTFTVLPGSPSKVIVLVQLDGSDTASPGYLRGAPEGEADLLRLVGSRCRVAFKDEPAGHWTDFWFALVN